MTIDIAKRLAEITGKPLDNFIKGVKDDENSIVAVAIEAEHEQEILESEPIFDDDEAEDNQGCTDSECEEEESSFEEDVVEYWTDEELSEFQNMFPGSTISEGGFIMGGQQMTRKEYLKFVKGMTYEENFCHPLHFKLFRAEGQQEAFYFRWCERFPKAEQDESEEQE